MSFTEDLAKRLVSHEQFGRDYDALQAEAARSTLPHGLSLETEPLDTDAVHRLLYCASVLVQTDSEPLRALAQSIALGSLLANREDVAAENALRLLTDLGNFPALTYAEARHADDEVGLNQSLRAALSRDLNAFDVGDERLALTDFQKKAWDRLQVARALAISAPTSAGKSFLVIEHLCRLAEQSTNFTAVYIAPTRALLSEIHAKVQRRLQGQDIWVSTIPSPGSDRSTRQIFVLTQERLQVLLAVAHPNFDLVVVDEAQNISDGARGMILQECLDQILTRNPKSRLVMLAPGAAGFLELGRSFGTPDLEPAESRLPSVIQNRILASPGRAPKSLTLRLMTETGSVKLGTLFADRGFQHPDSRLAAVALELGRQGGSLVYATGPKDAESVAQLLYQGCPDQVEAPLKALSKFIIRFRYVQLGKAYYDILVLALQKCGLDDRVPEIFDFALALELGVSTRSGWSFMELGLSRIAATALEPHFPDSDMTAARAREWLQSEDMTTFRLGPIVLAELARLGLASAKTLAGLADDDDLLGEDEPISLDEA